MDNGMFHPHPNIGARAVWMAPIRAGNIVPPAVVIVELNWMIRRREHNGAGDQPLRKCLRIVFWPRLALSDCDISRGIHESGELLIRYLGCVHPVAVHINAMPRSRIG